MIATYSQLLVNSYRGQLEGDAEACLHYITEGARRMRELLAGLLSYTHASAGRSELVTSVSLNTAFEKALQNLRTAVTDSGALVSADPLPTVVGEEAHFIQLLQNLIGNALKYRSSSEPRVHVSAQRQGTEWRIAVTDNGIGIAQADHQWIFGVFQRLPVNGVPGTGIGLAICQRVVERYGGRIWVESQLGQGATFYFTLPAVLGTAAGSAVCHA
jgi:light-regulated signal transduction histidine kinase (bacteriophytochrome)